MMQIIDNAYSLAAQKALTRQFEGLNLKPYRDTTGRWTIGIGRNLTDKGISRKEADFLFENDLLEALDDAETYEFWKDLDSNRKLVIVDMLFNLGPNGFATFHGFIKAVQSADYPQAAKELESSLWYQQVKSRAVRLVAIMQSGILPNS